MIFCEERDIRVQWCARAALWPTFQARLPNLGRIHSQACSEHSLKSIKHAASTRPRHLLSTRILFKGRGSLVGMENTGSCSRVCRDSLQLRGLGRLNLSPYTAFPIYWVKSRVAVCCRCLLSWVMSKQEPVRLRAGSEITFKIGNAGPAMRGAACSHCDEG